MTKETFSLLESYMLRYMDDSAHDAEHIYRVLYNALEIAKTEPDVDYDVLIAACLLHDIGRLEQFEDPSLCHAMVGGEKAAAFLTEHGFDEAFADHVRSCIQTHRFRKTNPPASIEARILFDADKLDATGAIGVARTLSYKAEVDEPLYTFLPNGEISDGAQDGAPSFFHEYKFKLEKLYDRFLTGRGMELAQLRRNAAAAFYESLYQEVSHGYAAGKASLNDLLK